MAGPGSKTSEKRGAIGVFDSGLGGLTVLRALLDRLPDADTIYLGDTARIPYGTRSGEVVTRYALRSSAFLLERGISLLVVACNTASAVALPALASALPIPVVGVVEPGARAAAAASRGGRIGVLGTAGTVRSGAYQRALHAVRPEAEVFVQACPLFVPLVEEGWTEGEVPRLVVEQYLAPMRAHAVDTLVLGCTHYPLLRAVLQDAVGSGVRLVDSAAATAQEVATLFGASPRAGKPRREFYVTDLPERFTELAGRFLGSPVDDIEAVDL